MIDINFLELLTSFNREIQPIKNLAIYKFRTI
jgi:hypothetical protein